MTLINATASAALVFGVGTFPSIIAGLLLFFIVQWLLVLAARRDPQAFDTYRRHIHHQKFYPASAWLHAVRRLPLA